MIKIKIQVNEKFILKIFIIYIYIYYETQNLLFILKKYKIFL
jgi:hypothetical protein